MFKRFVYRHDRHRRSFANSVWQVEKESIGRPVADQVTIRPEVDLRYQGIPLEEPQQDEGRSRKQCVGKLVRAGVSDPGRDALIAEMQGNTPFTPFSEESKRMIHTLGHVESFELCQKSHKIPSLHCPKYLEGAIVCDCGTCLIPSEEARRLNGERTFLQSFLHSQKGSTPGARHDRSEDQKADHQAK